MKKGKQEFQYKDDAFDWASKNYNPEVAAEDSARCVDFTYIAEKAMIVFLPIILFGFVFGAILGF